ncbi:hypothetical protein [Stenotrophomonas maltophilia]|uniref:hypothetical protein n=1 Tax=Stenotrophomonas maltophilia TaxID=40324 RepID=UPI00117E1B90|nr:hypothetical protein [Stenotrophomonas maltophilia]
MKNSLLDHPLPVRISAASLLMPLEPGEQPQLDLKGELDNGRTLTGESGEDLTQLPWDITIERLDEDESRRQIDDPPAHRGSAGSHPHAGKPECVAVTYSASAQAFDRLAAMLADGTVGIRLVLRVAGVKHDPKRIELKWPDARVWTAVTSVNVEVEYDVADQSLTA